MSFPSPLLLFLSIFFASFSIGYSVDLTCPSTPIDRNTQPTGSFPVTGGQLGIFPANYTCAIKFNIPDGYVVKFVIDSTAFGGAGGDRLEIFDSTGRLYNVNMVFHASFFSPANTSIVRITTVTNTSAFYFTWEYQYVANFGQIRYPSGTAMKLDLLAQYSHLFTSNLGPITLHTANLNNDRDRTLETIYVYDGADLNAPFLGNLFYLTYGTNYWKTSGRTMTLVNFYNITGPSYGIANDFDAVSGYAVYSFYLLSSSSSGSIQLGATTSQTVATTFLNIDSQVTYINSMTLNQNGVTIPQMLTFQPMSPTDKKSVLLAYNTNQQLSQYLPQQIPGRLFTMIATSCTATLNFVTGDYPDWYKATPGRKGTIFSPSLWDPMSPAAYTTNFTGTVIRTFTFTIPSVVIDRAGEKIRVEVGSPSSTPKVTEFSQTAANVGSRAANGTYMSTTFTGTSNNSSFWLTFAIDVADPLPTTTPSSIVTTTRASSSLFDFRITVCIVLIFKVLLK